MKLTCVRDKDNIFSGVEFVNSFAESDLSPDEVSDLILVMLCYNISGVSFHRLAHKMNIDANELEKICENAYEKLKKNSNQHYLDRI